MSRFTKKVSNTFNGLKGKTNDAISSDAVPTVSKWAVGGSVVTGIGIAAGMTAAGVLTIPLGIGFPIIAGGFAVGAATGKAVHARKKHKQQGPKPPKQ
jgi:hypothetical protein